MKVRSLRRAAAPRSFCCRPHRRLCVAATAAGTAAAATLGALDGLARPCARVLGAYTTLVEQAGVDNACRIGSGAQSWAQRASGLSRKQRRATAQLKSEAAQLDGARVALLEATLAALFEGARERECCIMLSMKDLQRSAQVRAVRSRART